MQYLAALGGSYSRIDNEVLLTNFILEAFGNAKTSRLWKLFENEVPLIGLIPKEDDICGKPKKRKSSWIV